MGKLIVLSNRVAMPGKNQAGGLAVALEEALREKGGLWCGWSGELREYPRTLNDREGKVDYIVTDLTREDHADYYVGFSNSALWPLFHYRVDLLHYSRDQYEGYLRVNWQFAELIAKHAGPDDTIWVHDYHLIPMAMALRERGVKSRIGFFLHIPFPAMETLAALPVAAEIVHALCAYDMVGFQTESDLRAFVRCASELVGASTFGPIRQGMVDLRLKDRRCRAGSFPISIDTQAMIDAAETAEHSEHAAQLKEALGGRLLIAGVDRMDYSKGIPARLDAYDAMLTRYPDLQRKVRFTQVTPTSRAEVEEYRQLREEVEARVARINGTYATLDWSPVHFLTSSFTREQLAGLYRAARVGLVTPLRDGMNLVAKEYVAAQNPEDPGVLVLSRFAGAAAELDAAVIVNPFDRDEMARAIAKALRMGLSERQERHSAMMAHLKTHTISRWQKNFLAALEGRDSPLKLQVITMPQPLASPMQAQVQ